MKTIKIQQDLTDVKIADKKKQILEVLEKWLIQVRQDYNGFRSEFLSNKQDKYFLEIKKIIGDFKGLSKMSVLNFLAIIILGIETEHKILKELQKEYIKLKEERNKKYPK